MSETASRSKIQRAARILGIPFALFWLFVTVARTLSGPFWPQSPEDAVMTVLPLLLSLAVLLAWRWEGIGGAVLVVGGLAFGIFGFAAAGRYKPWVALATGGPFLLSGILFLLSWRVRRV